MSDGEAQPSYVIRCCAVGSGGDVIQPGSGRRGDEERALCILHGSANGIVHP